MEQQLLARYDDLCAVFGVPHSKRPASFTLLYRLPDHSLFLDAARLNLKDGHALALACSLLVSTSYHSTNLTISPDLILEFIATYWKQLSRSHPRHTSYSCGDPRTLGPHVHAVLAKHSATNITTTPPPAIRWSMWRFKDSRHLSGAAVSMLVAAASICGVISNENRQLLELDFAACASAQYLDLYPWVDIVEKIIPSRYARCFGLRGIRLDLCPLTNLGKDPHRLLNGVKWLSLRETKLKNLWSLAGIIRNIPSLEAVQVAGDARAAQVPDNNNVTTTTSTSSSSSISLINSLVIRSSSSHSSPPPGSASSPPKRKIPRHANDIKDIDLYENRIAVTLLNYYSSSLSSKTPKPLSIDGIGSMTLKRDNGIPYLTYAEYMANRLLRSDQNDDEEEGSDATPVTLKPFYREFMLAHARPGLRFFDGIPVTASCVAAAKPKVYKHYELTFPENNNNPGTGGNGISFHRMLRNRELQKIESARYARVKKEKNAVHLTAASSSSRRAGRECTLIATSTPTPKRRRNGEYDASIAKIPTGAPAAASTSTATIASMESILGDALRRNGNTYFKADKYLDTLNRIGSNSSTVTWKSLDGNSYSSSTPSCSTSVEFNADKFEGACVTEFLRRPGRPRVEYLCEPKDRPRQFEYNQLDTRLLVYGTEHSNLVVLNQETMTVEGSCKVGGGPAYLEPGTPIRVPNHTLPPRAPFEEHGNTNTNPVLGLSWFNKDRDMFIAGSEDGNIQIYNVEGMRERRDNNRARKNGFVRDGERFPKLTSLHANCEDDKYLVSGYSNDVALFDIASGRKLEHMNECHSDHINVLKFSHTSPHIFVTSSFDHTIKKWDLRERRPGGTRRPIFECENNSTGFVMVCWSCDDRYILGSGTNNEVIQYCAKNGSIDLELDIARNPKQKFNYTRSYYMNGRDYIISGNCTEDVVRIYNAKTGHCAREVEMDKIYGYNSNSNNLFIQSLRGNPRKKHNLSALLSTNEKIYNTNNNNNNVRYSSSYYCIANIDLYARE